MFILYIKMETTKTVPYLKRLNTNEGTRQNPHLPYVTHGGKKRKLYFPLERRKFVLSI